MPWYDLLLKVSLCHSKDQYHTTFSCNKHCKTIRLSKNSTLSQPRLKNKTKEKNQTKQHYQHANNRFHKETYSVKPVINQVLDVFAHPDLSHELVLVSIHSSQLTNMGEDVLQAISKLKYTHNQKAMNL